MWNLWYITFGLLTLFVVGLAIGIALTIRVCRYRKLANDTEVEIEVEKERAWHQMLTNQEKIKELKRLKDKYEKIYINTTPFIGWGIAIISGVFSFLFLLTCIFCPVGAQKEVNYFIAQKEYVEMAIKNGSELENVAITQIVIEQNQWLANAKASAQTYGAWSVYYGIDFSQLSPIEIKRE